MPISPALDVSLAENDTNHVDHHIAIHEYLNAMLDQLRSSYEISGYYQFCTFPVRTTTAAFTLNRLVSSPLHIATDCTVDRIGINVTAFGSAGAVQRLGIYHDDGFGRPGARLLDAGAVSSAGSNGFKEITISQALPAGLYHLAAVGQVATATVTTNGDGNSTTGLPAAASGSGLVHGCLVDSISGALPDPFGFTNTSTQAPRVGVRYV